ncbi:hypothetical protein O3P69_015169 [Scylla paramamosain]|uniref:Protein AAR2 homolog n=1 Tax=Scylla paramamosain TaxID=85552 RepID=A0AAW0T4U0_SCYPA
MGREACSMPRFKMRTQVWRDEMSEEYQHNTGMSQQMAWHLTQEGVTLVILGIPPGKEFGIDINFWNVGEWFWEEKMIPPGLHFIYSRSLVAGS